VRRANELLGGRVLGVALHAEPLQDAAHGGGAAVVGLLQDLGLRQLDLVNIDPPFPDLGSRIKAIGNQSYNCKNVQMYPNCKLGYFTTQKNSQVPSVEPGY
jgi:hypothetical protein